MHYVLLYSNEDSYDAIRAYELWHSVWSETFFQLDGTITLNSDDFTRQDWIGALFDPITENCAGR